jgi:hypothetical protein
MSSIQSLFNKTANRPLGLLSLGIASTLLTACGQQAFVSTQLQQQQKAPGYFTIAPKVDLLIAQDDTGSVLEIKRSLESQVPGFLQELEQQGWDYHFSAMPLTQSYRLTQALASRQDSNWGELWTAPYPGARPGGEGTLSSDLFRITSQFSGFNLPAGPTDGSEPGLQFITENTQRIIESRSGFIRNDALLVVLAISNGNDTSRVNYCRRSDGAVIPCEDMGYPTCTSWTDPRNSATSPTCGTKTLSLNLYREQLAALKPSLAQLQFHAAVAARNSSNCLGGYSRPGSRYQAIAQELSGASYDLCTQPISSILSTLASQLQTVRVGYRTRYVPLEREPSLNSIDVYRIDGTTGTRRLLAPGPENGWTYAGYLRDQASIDYPVEMNRITGYALELHGSARLIGNDRAEVVYRISGSESLPSR